MPSIINDVLLGEDGWMFLWQGAQRQFDHLTGILSPTQQSIEAFLENVEQRSLISAARGLPYVHVVYPSKPVVMKTAVPNEMSKNIDSLFERHYASALNHKGSECLLYPRKMLVEESSVRQVFSKHDTHMTSTGNALISREILRVLGYDHDPLGHMESEIRPRQGDLARMLSVQDVFPEVILSARPFDAVIFDNRSSLPSNTNNIAIAYNHSSSSSLRLLAIGDSFLRDGLNSLSTFFRDILYVRSDLFQPELLDLFAPDAVVSANAERYLASVRSDHQAESMLLRSYGLTGYQPLHSFASALRAQLSFSSYPRRYSEWVARHEALYSALTFAGLGTAKSNDQLAVVPEQPGWLEATGPDPNLIFSDVEMNKGRNYRVSILMESTVCGSAQFFVGRSSFLQHEFSEEHSSRQKVVIGKNFLEFDVAAEERGRRLRFDPLNCRGRLRIISVEISPQV